VGSPTPFQVRLLVPSTSCIHHLPISCFSISFFEDHTSVSISNLGQTSGSGTRSVSLGNIDLQSSNTHQVNADLSLDPGSSIVVYGEVSSDIPTELRVSINFELESEHNSF
jgi:hypothetical protein